MSSSPSVMRRPLWWIVAAVVLVAAAAAFALSGRSGGETAASDEPEPSHAGKVADETVRVSAAQLAALDIGPAGERTFQNLQQAIGNIDFNQDRTVAVSTAYAGRIARVLVKAGDEVQAGQTLYTVDVPDIAQAASTLISTAGSLRTANDTLKRAQALAQDNSIPQKELQQNQSDQQAADAAFRAARKTLQLFGLAEADIARIEREHTIDVEMPVRSPIAGRVTARAAQVGLLTQPGASPAPVTVSDLRTLWMVASIPESDFALYRIGQPVKVRVQAWPDRTFEGRISYLGDTVDANTHRISVRADVADPKRELRPQMLADFSISLSAPAQAPSVPAAAVVRETSGVNTVWVSAGTDAQGKLLKRRQVTVGRTDQGQVQIASGLQPGEQVARRNALFLSNLYEANAE
ncbi:efflux RND transporter periplasmic adaptor subunit [Xylophilus rhododendri]|uniref:Efflux RND transporter periplasmic adaptor subunit n=1 Tax=Xylophilus rhododendri TaxID=2697032 RepID=A0A857J934_9BURK|nr:efflux RND transporter periplasmic adaptor subunit [Xylophilus rhododendri]QHI99512.1 efflux RND transporter periplasmic adaptor subunit [Xylophilus rhododendri]